MIYNCTREQIRIIKLSGWRRTLAESSSGKWHFKKPACYSSVGKWPSFSSRRTFLKWMLAWQHPSSDSRGKVNTKGEVMWISYTVLWIAYGQDLSSDQKLEFLCMITVLLYEISTTLNKPVMKKIKNIITLPWNKSC